MREVEAAERDRLKSQQKNEEQVFEGFGQKEAVPEFSGDDWEQWRDYVAQRIDPEQGTDGDGEDE